MRAGSTSVITRRSSGGWYPSGCRRKLKSQIKILNGNLPTTKYLEALLEVAGIFLCAGFPCFNSFLLFFITPIAVIPTSLRCQRAFHDVLIAAVYASLPSNAANLIQQSTLSNKLTSLILNGMGQGEAIGMRIGEREEGLSRFLSVSEWRAGFVLFANCIGHIYTIKLFPCGYLYFIFENCTCY